MPDPDLKTVIQQQIATHNDPHESHEFELTAYRIRAPQGPEHDFVEPVLGIAVEFPNGGVYADWNINAWPDGQRLEYPHVSIYGSLDDFEQVSEGNLERLDSIDAYGD